jgi:DnaJ-class molecular chaperone
MTTPRRRRPAHSHRATPSGDPKTKAVRMTRATLRYASHCPACEGTGTLHGTACLQCDGTGLVS